MNGILVVQIKNGRFLLYFKAKNTNKMVKMCYSKYRPSLATQFSHLSANLWMPRQKKNQQFAMQTIHQPKF